MKTRVWNKRFWLGCIAIALFGNSSSGQTMLHQKFYSDSSLWMQTIFYDSAHIIEEEYSRSNGSLWSVLRCAFVSDSLVYHGEGTYYHFDRQVLRKVNYHYGQLTGESTTFYKGGEIKDQFTYRNGLVHGDYKAYYKSGKLSARGRYKKGYQVGQWRFFYENGQVQAKGRFSPTIALDTSRFEFADSTCQPNNFKEHLDPFINQKVQLKQGIWRIYDCKGSLVKKYFF